MKISYPFSHTSLKSLERVSVRGAGFREESMVSVRCLKNKGLSAQVGLREQNGEKHSSWGASSRKEKEVRGIEVTSLEGSRSSSVGRAKKTRTEEKKGKIYGGHNALSKTEGQYRLRSRLLRINQGLIFGSGKSC